MLASAKRMFKKKLCEGVEEEEEKWKVPGVNSIVEDNEWDDNDKKKTWHGKTKSNKGKRCLSRTNS